MKKTISALLLLFVLIFTVPVSAETDVETEPCEHQYNNIEFVAPTYFKEGFQKDECLLCGDIKETVIPKKKGYNQWVKDGDNRYYFGSDGKPVKGWKKITQWRYFNSKGVLKKSVKTNTKNKWIKVDGRKYYFGSNASPVKKGFRIVNDRLYYFKEDRSVKVGKVKVDGKTYKTSQSGSIGGLPYYKYKYRTFVLIDISEQNLKYYKNTKRKLNTNIVSGKNYSTPTGSYRLRAKARNVYLRGATWNSFVKYWMPFLGNAYGMHDASWRRSSEFSNKKTFIRNGSHGCVNMRPADAKKLYSMIEIGTRVMIRN